MIPSVFSELNFNIKSSSSIANCIKNLFKFLEFWSFWTIIICDVEILLTKISRQFFAFKNFLYKITKAKLLTINLSVW